MKKIVDFIVANKLAIIISLVVMGVYYYTTFSGDRICNCEKTEKEKRTRVNRFYNSNSYHHK